MKRIILKKIGHTFVNAFLAGLLISLGAMVYLATGMSMPGSFLFTIGLLVVMIYGYDLYTGKVGYLLEQKGIFWLETLVSWFGNFAGAYAMGAFVRLTRLFDQESVFRKSLDAIEATKYRDDHLSLLALGVLCGICIYFAVNTYKKAEAPIARFLIPVLAVMVFLNAGFEHCVADMFYFSLIHPFSGETFSRLITITLGNTLGGLVIPSLRMLRQKLS